MSTSRICAGILVVAGMCGVTAGQCDDEQLLTANMPNAGARFGVSVAVDGEWLIVGAPESDLVGTDAGAVHVFNRVGDQWQHAQVLTASDAFEFDDFGRSVAIQGEFLIVGAPGKDIAGSNEGVAYVFEFHQGTWTQDQILKLNSPDDGDRFGWSVDIDAGTAVVGAFGVDLFENSDGIAMVFTTDGNSWTIQDLLFASDGTGLAQFGRSVAIDDERVIVGAWQDDDQGFFTGSAYFFTRQGNEWIEEQKIIADDATAFQKFGGSVDLEGAFAIIGAYGDEDAAGFESGAAYVFTLDAGIWDQQDKLTASDAAVDARFGWSVAIDGANAWVGAVGAPDSGEAYLFRLAGEEWNESLSINGDDGGIGAELGSGVGAGGGFGLIGAALWNVGQEEDAGAVISLGSCTCPGDFNGDGVLNVLDFVAYQQAWVLQNPAADCDENAAFNILDFVCFSLLFNDGCP